MPIAARLLLAGVFCALALVAAQLRAQRRVAAQVSLSAGQVNDAVGRARAAAGRYDESFAALVSALSEKASTGVLEDKLVPLIRHGAKPNKGTAAGQRRLENALRLLDEEEWVSSAPPGEGGIDGGGVAP